MMLQAWKSNRIGLCKRSTDAHTLPQKWGSSLGILLVLTMPLPAIAQPAPLRLSEAEISRQSQTLPDWTRNGQMLTCTYQVANFVESVELVNQIVPPAEAAGHHPDVAIAYNRVTFNLTTHDAGGLTALDFQVARQIAQVAATTHPGLRCGSSRNL